VTQVEQITPDPRVITVGPVENVWFNFDGHGELTAHDVVQRFNLHYWPMANGFRATTRRPASFGWYASQHDADVDEGLCAVIGGGRVSVTRLADGSLRFASSADSASQRPTFVVTGVRA
jgi:hypothetical protein